MTILRTKYAWLDSVWCHFTISYNNMSFAVYLFWDLLSFPHWNGCCLTCACWINLKNYVHSGVFPDSILSYNMDWFNSFMWVLIFLDSVLYSLGKLLLNGNFVKKKRFHAHLNVSTLFVVMNCKVIRAHFLIVSKMLILHISDRFRLCYLLSKWSNWFNIYVKNLNIN